MQTLDQALICFFEKAAERDEILMHELEREPRFALSPDRWCFTLPDLFSFLRPRFKAIGKTSYNEFRRAVYSAPINTTTKRHGAEIVIDQNHGHVDKSVYAMKWRQRKDGGGTSSSTRIN